MALGTITILEEAAVQGPIRWLRCTIVGDDSYPTGGTTGFTALLRAATPAANAPDPADVTVVDLKHLQGQGGTVIDGELHYDHTNDTLLSTVRSTAAEVANATDLSSNTYHCLVAVK